ncbi:hypothetical protein CXB77_05600 [Chromatium okenii]|uniref:Helicase/UvrB N-terminal domain-containing protein n=1 Tax=Chromatium okenii TaxID=61644 RepID=A0A2S7XSU6_9GAMM|nr:hypothetical protein CXB77_05600 [Chromatium okenii]
MLLRQVPRLPLEITSPELIDAVCGAIPECTDETRLALSGALDEAITTAIRRAREDNQLNANLTLDSIQEVIPAMRTLWAQGHRCFLIRAPMGSGKTQLVLKTIFDQINNVVALTYSTTLVDNLVSRFEGATHYQDMAVNECALVEKIVACINSIGKINIRKSLDAAKAILADEIAHVVRVLYDPDGTLKSTAGAITRQFFDAIKATVKHGIFAGVDANLNDLTVAAFRHNGAKPYVIDVVDHNPPKPMKIHRSEKRIWWSASNEVNDGGRVFIACSGAKESLRVDRHLRAQCPGKKGLVINSRGGYATSGDPNQRAWFKDVNGLVVQYDWIIFSPAVESGVSIEVKHFTKWFGIYDGTKCASDFHQMLARDRTATGYEVAITGTLKKPAPRTAKEELADALYCAHLDHGSIIEASSYDVVAAVFEVVRKRRVQYYGQEFCCMSQDLFDVEIDRKEVNDSEFNAYRKKIWDSIESEFVADVKDRPALSEATFEQIASNYTPDRYDSQDVHAHTITKALGIPLSELTTQAVNIYHEGRITSQLERFRFATEPDRVVESTADDIGVLDVMLRRNRKAVAQACRVFYQELGLDFFNLQSTRKRKGRLVTSDEIKGSLPQAQSIYSTGSRHMMTLPQSAVTCALLLVCRKPAFIN